MLCKSVEYRQKFNFYKEKLCISKLTDGDFTLCANEVIRAVTNSVAVTNTFVETFRPAVGRTGYSS